jgi:uncharacterized protein (TIGR04562 family)
MICGAFNATNLETLLGDRSPLEIQTLEVHTLDQAAHFVRAYGYDLSNPVDTEKLWDYYRRALSFISSELLEPGESIPESLADPKALKDLRYLLIYASTVDTRPDALRRWACGILRVMHVLSHLENDLFTTYSSHIQEQVLKPFQDHVFDDPVAGVELVDSQKLERLPLKKFEIKSFKSSDSSILKLLAKREAIAFGLLDKVGVRFVTKSLFDVFYVLRFLLDKSLVSFPHVVAGQSNNTLYPVNLFMEVIAAISPEHPLTVDHLDRLLKEKLAKELSRAEFVEKPNVFSSAEYKFIKFISRRLVRVPQGDRVLSFFYPYEVQIIDYETHLKNLAGPSSHGEYKNRQRLMARRRVLGTGQ